MTEEETNNTNTGETTTPVEPTVIGNIQYDFNENNYRITFKGKTTIKNPQNTEKHYVVDTTNGRVYKKIGDKKTTILPSVPPAITGSFTDGAYTVESLIGQTSCEALCCDKAELGKEYVYLEQYLSNPVIYKEDIKEFLNWLVYFYLHPVFSDLQAEYISYKTSSDDGGSEGSGSETEPETITVEIVPACLGTQELTFSPTAGNSGDLVIGAGTGILENGTTNYFLLDTDTTDDTKLNWYYITSESTTAIYEPLTPADDTITHGVNIEVDPETGDDIILCYISGEPAIVSESLAEKLAHEIINTINRLVVEEEIPVEVGGETLFMRIPNPLGGGISLENPQLHLPIYAYNKITLNSNYGRTPLATGYYILIPPELRDLAYHEYTDVGEMPQIIDNITVQEVGYYSQNGTDMDLWGVDDADSITYIEQHHHLTGTHDGVNYGWDIITEA